MGRWEGLRWVENRKPDFAVKIRDPLGTEANIDGWWTPRELVVFDRYLQAARQNAAHYLAIKPFNVAMEERKLQWIERQRDRILAFPTSNHFPLEQKWLSPEHLDEAAKKWIGSHFAAWCAEQVVKETQPGQRTLESYLFAVDNVLSAARAEPGSLRPLDDQTKQRGDADQVTQAVWLGLRNARIFDFTPADFGRMYEAADRYTTTQIAKMEFHPERRSHGMIEAPRDLPYGEITKFIDRVEEAGSRVPFPEPLPFDSLYIGFGEGALLRPEQLLWRIMDAKRRESVCAACVLGYLINQTADGPNAWEISHVIEEHDNYILPLPLAWHGVWERPMVTLAPWILTHFVSLINEHRTIITERQPGLGMKRDYEKARKKYRMPALMPKPYYIVRMEKKLIDDCGTRTRENLARIARELSYRHDRRGHERCYIRRGKHPLAVKDAQKLHEAGYMIWTLDEPDANAYRQLLERGQPPKAADEWIAILTKWIDPQVVGPEDKPYIPAIRLPALDTNIG